VLAACGAGTIEGGPPPGDDDDPAVDAPVEGTPASLRVSFSTTTKNGQYAPRNCVAVWVENNGAFVRTIDRKAAVRAQHLVAWRTLATAADMDAVSGASRTDHATPISLTWDLKDNGVEIADGTYTIRMEMTEDNATQASQNNEGTFTFVKGPAPQLQSGLSTTGFTNVTIDFTPGT
jgi:hypothetical protein